MATENDVLDFLREQRKATLAEVAEALSLRKYGPRSAYTMLDSLREQGLVERKGDYWYLRVAPAPPTPTAAPQALGVSPDVQAVIEAMAKALSSVMSRAPTPADEWQLAKKPMEVEIEEERGKQLMGLLIKPDERPEEAAKELLPFPTETLLDELFLTHDAKPLGGIPLGAQIAITGLPGSGKSILVEEIAIRAANSGKNILFVTAEDTWKAPTPRYDLQARLVKKAELLGLSWGEIVKHLFVMDTVACPELRDWTTFAETYRYIAEKENIELAIFDSVTVLETYRGALKYRVMELCRFNQLHGITALYVNQRSTESWDGYDMAGGIGLAHNLDATVIVDYGRVYWFDQQQDLGLKRGEFVRIVRVLDCRLCNFDRRRILVEITPDGFLRAVKKEELEEA